MTRTAVDCSMSAVRSVWGEIKEGAPLVKTSSKAGNGLAPRMLEMVSECSLLTQAFTWSSMRWPGHSTWQTASRASIWSARFFMMPP